MHCLPQSGEAPIKAGVKKACSTFHLVGMPWLMGLQNSSKKQKMKQIKFIVVSWNVQTLLDGDNSPERRRALIVKELARYLGDIATLQEARLEGQGQLKESMHTFFWIGKPVGCREAGVAYLRDSFISEFLFANGQISEHDQCICTDHDLCQQRERSLLSRTCLSNGSCQWCR